MQAYDRGGFIPIVDNFFPLKKRNSDHPHVPSAPTISEVVMWIYKNNGIWINVFQNYGFLTFSIMLNKNGDVINNIIKEFNLPSEAYEYAIYYVLNNLI